MDKKMYINLDKDDEEDQELLDMLDNKVKVSKSTKVFARNLGEIKEEDEEKLNKEDTSRNYENPGAKNNLEEKNKKIKLVINIPEDNINDINNNINNIITKDNKFLNSKAIKTPTNFIKYNYMNKINNFKIFRNNNNQNNVDIYNPLLSSKNNINNLTNKSPQIENSKNNFFINNSKKYRVIPDDAKCPTAIFQTISNSINDVIVPIINKNKRNCNSRCQNKNNILARQFNNNIKKEDKYLRQKINTAPNKKIKNLVIEREMFNSANDSISLYGKLHKIKIEKGMMNAKLANVINKQMIDCQKYLDQSKTNQFPYMMSNSKFRSHSYKRGNY